MPAATMCWDPGTRAHFGARADGVVRPGRGDETLIDIARV